MGHIRADQIAAHHTACKYDRPQCCLRHPGKGLGHTQQAVFADVGSVFSLLQQSFALIFQAGQTAVHPADGSFRPHAFAAQGRLFAYGDAQRYRLGVNHNHIPVNRPRCPYAEFHRDGMMRTDGNFGGTIGYEPNSYGQWQQQAEAAEPPLDLFGPMDAWDPADDPTDDTFYQPGDLYRLMEEPQRAALIGNTARNMEGVTENIRLRHAAHCYKADPEYGDRLAEALGVDANRVHELAQMTHEERMAVTGQQVPARKIGGEVRA